MLKSKTKMTTYKSRRRKQARSVFFQSKKPRDNLAGCYCSGHPTILGGGGQRCCVNTWFGRSMPQGQIRDVWSMHSCPTPNRICSSPQKIQKYLRNDFGRGNRNGGNRYHKPAAALPRKPRSLGSSPNVRTLKALLPEVSSVKVCVIVTVERRRSKRKRNAKKHTRQAKNKTQPTGSDCDTKEKTPSLPFNSLPPHKVPVQHLNRPPSYDPPANSHGGTAL